MNNNNPHIIIIDDEKGLREGTKRLLEEENYTVDTAENGLKGIELIKKNDYDLAIIDLRMPDIEGTDVLKELKLYRPNTVSFIATAYASFETAVESTRLGAYSYIPKPFSPDELLHQLKQGYKQRLLLLEAERLKIEREKNLLEIAHEKSRLKTIIEAISSGVLLINKEGEVVYYNNATLHKLNIDRLNIGERIRGKLPDKIAAILDSFLVSDEYHDKSVTAQIEIIPQNRLVIDATFSPVPHPDGSFAGVVIVLKNITGFKQVEHIKNEFISMVAHELKTPIAAVLGYIKIILDDTIPVTYEQQHDFLSRSHIRLKSLLDLINDLLDISRMELKTKQREIQKIDIKEILESSLNLLEIEISKKRLEITTDIDYDLPELKADYAEISRVLLNLLSNAIKYNIENGKIFIKIHQSPNHLIIKVEDTGIGIKTDDKEKIFSEFFRAKNKFTRSISGTGLGLTIVKRIVESYHGKIDVESEYEKGTAFTIHLPINK